MSITIVGSYFASISNFRGEWERCHQISVLDEYGVLNTSKWRMLCSRIANDGASATRQIPFWSTCEEDHTWMPYHYENGTFDLSRFRSKYFDNLREMAKIANSYNLVFIFSLYDHCHTKNKHVLRAWNPWCNNRQDLENDFYGPDASVYRREWEKRVYKALAGLRVQYEICNEPGGDCYRFITDTFAHLEQNGVRPDSVICGLEYRFDRDRNGRYNDFIKALKKEKGALYTGALEKTWLTAVHGFKEDDFRELKKRGTSGMRFYLSDDGNSPKHDREWFYRNYSQYFRDCPDEAFENRCYIECMFKTVNDDFRAVRGVSRALIEQKGIFPGNWGKYPEFPINYDQLRLDRLHENPIKTVLKRITNKIKTVFKRMRPGTGPTPPSREKSR